MTEHERSTDGAGSTRQRPDQGHGLSPLDIRTVSLAVMAVIATLVALQWAKDALIPILLGVLLSYALSPLVGRLEKWKIPRAAGAAVSLTALVGLLVWGAWSLSDQADELLETLPSVTAKVRALLDGKRSAPSTFKKVERAVAEIEAVANARPGPRKADAAAGRPAASASAPVAPIASPPPGSAQDDGTPAGASSTRIDLRAYLLSGTVGVLLFLAQAVAVVFIALFMLVSGNTFRRKMVKLAGPRLTQKKVTVHTLNEISEQIQRYLLLQLGMSMLVGVATWLVFYALGLEQSAVWGVVAGVTNLIPYLGAVLVGVGSAVVAFVQFGTIDMALAVFGASFAIRTLNGNVIAPWLMGRASRMNPVIVFATVIVFGWLWGVWGLLLGVPILMVVKTVCDRVEGLQTIGELLAE